MNEKPILFSEAMVKAILQGHKTQTRRVIAPQPDGVSCSGNPYLYKEIVVVRDHCLEKISHPDGQPNTLFIDIIKCPYQEGMKLWVRETWNVLDSDGCRPRDITPRPKRVIYRARGDKYPFWRPSIFMPRWASRLQLLIKNITAERLQDITKEDAIAEGIRFMYRDLGMVPCSWYEVPGLIGTDAYGIHDVRRVKEPVDGFRELWDSINSGYAWNTNPWVWKLEFEVIKSDPLT